MNTLAEVRLWGRRIGAVSLADDSDTAAFQYDPAFAASGIEVAPITMPLSTRVYRFPQLPPEAFHGLPGLLADSLPDRFGNAVIDAWLATQGRTPEDFNAVERLCYTGARGMGALEFVPATGPGPQTGERLHIAALVELASDILVDRSRLHASFDAGDRTTAMREILRVGTSAGGARAKAVIAWNRQTGEVRSGQLPPESGFEPWILKFDGVGPDPDLGMQTPQGHGAIEYAYACMARAAGIRISECRLLEEGGRRHFMTRRFDRDDSGGKLHMQTLAALAHYDYNASGAHGYEQALQVIRRLGLGIDTIEEQYRRMVFNIVARNQDDHVKNIAFLMDRAGRWSLSPAYDLTYSHNPAGRWTARHQMTLNGKREDFTRADFRACARTASMQRSRADTIVGEVLAAVAAWPQHAAAAGVEPHWRERIGTELRLTLPD